MARRPDSEIQKKKSRDAARQRRGQQNDEFSELASQLPIIPKTTSNLDRLCVMRLSNSFVKMKHIIRQVTGTLHNIKKEVNFESTAPELSIMDALDGFIFVLSEDGQCLYVSPNVAQYLGISQLDITGCSFYKYVHPCDQEELAQQLGGQVPLEDMEIFDGLFCSDLPSVMKAQGKKPVCKKRHSDWDACRSFFIRMKSTLTSRGKSVNLNASIYRVIHCIGKVQSYQTKFSSANDELNTTCLVAVGTPLLASPTFDVPLDKTTFTSTHTLDLRVIDMENIAYNILGYGEKEFLDKSWYQYIHTSDINVVKSCHELMLSKGQSVSGYYRVLTKQGGWIWMLTKGNIVYSNTSFQPQYIININYVVSGVENKEQLLASEQMQSVIKITKHGCKRAHETSNNSNGEAVKFQRGCRSLPSTPGSDSFSSEESLASSRMEELERIIKNQEHYEDLLAEQYSRSNDYDSSMEDEVPKLEVIDFGNANNSPDNAMKDATDADLLWRAPFVMTSSSDEVLYVPGCSPISFLNDDVNIDEDKPEDLAARAPFVPPPNDDTILTFDDLPDSPLFSVFDNAEGGAGMPELFLEEPFENKMVAIGPATVPYSRVKKAPEKDQENDPEMTSLDDAKKEKSTGVMPLTSKHNNILPWISTTVAEVNAPSGRLLDGDDLLSALENTVST